VAERVREAGGLSGERRQRIPLRPVEWGALAGLVALAGFSRWPKRGWTIAGVALSAALATAPQIERAVDGGAERAVLLRTATLEGSDIELEPGQVVRVLDRGSSSLKVRVGTIEGRLPSDAVASALASP